MAESGAIHDAFEREEQVVGPSNRAFGLVMAAAFAIAWSIQLWRGGEPRHWTLAAATLFLAAALVLPGVLMPLNRLWLRLGLAVRALGKGLAPRLGPDPRADSYWFDRSQQPASRMDQQF